MGLHMMAMATLSLQLSSHSLSPAVAGISCTLALKLFPGLRLFREEAVYAARLFIFRLGRIAFNTDLPVANGVRLGRALQLIWRTVTAGATTPSEDSELGQEQETFHALSMLAL